MSNDWIKSGDRSHPNLKLIDDELRHQLTYPGHEDDLDELERAHLMGETSCFGETLHKIRESQKLGKGDRSHPRMVILDALRSTLSYDGWEEDCEEAERSHLDHRHDVWFNRAVKGIERRQAIHDGDRTHDNVRCLDSLSLSYPGWEADVEDAMARWHFGGQNNVRYPRYYLTERQKMFVGDRSHPRLVALDALKLTYPRWREDVAKMEKAHLSANFWVCDDARDGYGEVLAILTRKQQEFVTGVLDTSSMHPAQREIVETHWTYPSWQEDVEKVRENFEVPIFDLELEKCRLKQMVHDHDFGQHPALIKLDKMQFSYPGWETDAEEVKHNLCTNGYCKMTSGKACFDQNINGMMNKQVIYDGVQRSQKMKITPKSEDHGPFGVCKICWDTPCTHVFVPCGHVCVCGPCGKRVMNENSLCPICNQYSSMAMEIFVP